jgi:hypothetical protein
LNTLCIATNLTSSEIASWIQAVGTILAVLAAAGIAVWQSRKQHESSVALHKSEQRHTRVEMAKTLLVLSQNCTKAANHFASQMRDRDAVHKIASKETYFDFGELNALQKATSSIPLHELPHTLVTPSMVLAATVRQFQQTVDMAVKLHRSMDSEQFSELFKTLGEMNESLELTCGDINEAVKLVQKDA